MEDKNYQEADTRSQENNNNVVEQCQAEVAQLKQELARFQDQYKYALADLDNVRKRHERERIQIIQASQAALLRDLVAIVDDFDRTFQEFKKGDNLDARLTGFEFIYKALHKLLTTYGVEEITQTQQFDPEIHEAISQEIVEGKESGTISQVLQKGYRFKGMVLRPARVVVVQ
jgi:molecular chaperone GrpE